MQNEKVIHVLLDVSMDLFRDIVGQDPMINEYCSSKAKEKSFNAFSLSVEDFRDFQLLRESFRL